MKMRNSGSFEYEIFIRWLMSGQRRATRDSESKFGAADFFFHGKRKAKGRSAVGGDMVTETTCLQSQLWDVFRTASRRRPESNPPEDPLRQLPAFL